MLKIPKTELYQSSKILSFNKAILMASSLKKSGKTVGLCHGGFDLLHMGHIKHFESAKKFCDVLIVSVTGDRYVRERKGDGRPVYTDKLRAYMIAHLDMVDYVVITDFKRGAEAIRAIKPMYYIKGPDFIGRATPGITAEREAIEAVGGKIIFTKDIKHSTTEIIQYIQNLKQQSMLIIADRDGTLTKNDEFFGRNNDWKKELQLNIDVVSFLSFLQMKYRTTCIVVSNQSGVARGYFNENRIREINLRIGELLKNHRVTVDNWQYCPDVDIRYAASHYKIRFIKTYIRQKTKRKPSPAMVTDGLLELGKQISDFLSVLVLGDSKDDENLAGNLNAEFINVKNKKYDTLVSHFHRINKM
jgi:rfaE bifunctional protein nucleotidyltransferase chain/domain